MPESPVERDTLANYLHALYIKYQAYRCLETFESLENCFALFYISTVGIE